MSITFEKTIKGIADAIREWELEAGEAFTDYFMDGTISWNIWYGFLIGKGLLEQAQELENESMTQKYISQEYFEPFEYYDGSFLEDIYYKNILLWAELIYGSNTYYNKFETFIKEYFEDES